MRNSTLYEVLTIYSIGRFFGFGVFGLQSKRKKIATKIFGPKFGPFFGFAVIFTQEAHRIFIIIRVHPSNRRLGHTPRLAPQMPGFIVFNALMSHRCFLVAFPVFSVRQF
jgi:hypothetical protein